MRTLLSLVAAITLALTSACAEVAPPTPTEAPTKVPTPTPTEIPAPTPTKEVTPTIAIIEIDPREIGGVTGEEMLVEFEGESQRLFRYTLSNGESFFRLGFYPDLPEISESPDLVNEVVYYQDQPFVFLTTMAPLEGPPDFLPFYDRNIPEVGVLKWIRGKGVISQQGAFEQLQEGEASVRFDPETGTYRFLDEEGKILRTKEIYKGVKEYAPAIEGLAYNQEDGKYYTEAGNPYGLEAGIYAGEKIEYNHGKETGVVLIPAVVKVLMEQANTPEAIAAGDWKIPFPLDARGEENLVIEEWFFDFARTGEKWGLWRITSLSPEAVFTSPISQRTMVYLANSPNFGRALLLDFPFEQIEKDAFLQFIYPVESRVIKDGLFVNFGEALIWDIRGELHGPRALSGTTALFFKTVSTLSGSQDLDTTDNILEIGGNRVFLASST